MHRFFLGEGNTISRNLVLIGQTDASHVRALRMKIGESFIVCDGQGIDYLCRITRLSDGIEAEIIAESPSASEPDVKCLMLVAFPKGDKAESIIKRCTEAGADAFLFFPSARCVSLPSGRALEKKLERWRKIARESAMQSGRGIIPNVDAISGFTQALECACSADLPLMMYETGERLSLKDALNSKSAYTSVSIITGSEGGFEPHEAIAADTIGIKLCSMGPRIFRCETAPLCALSAIMYHTGNM